jgi:hypothetical protein
MIPTSSLVSRWAVATTSPSRASIFPPGKAICPDHGSRKFFARSMKNTSGEFSRFRNIKATEARLLFPGLISLGSYFLNFGSTETHEFPTIR